VGDIRDDGWDASLTWSEYLYASRIGGERNIVGRENHRFNRYGAHDPHPELGWSRNAEGSGGEMAGCKLLGFFYNGNPGNFRARDAGPFQIRQSIPDDADLRLTKKDDDDHIHILVTGAGPTYTMRGWAFGYEGKKRTLWRDGAKDWPAYWLKQSLLRPMNTIRRYLPKVIKRPWDPIQYQYLRRWQFKPNVHDLTLTIQCRSIGQLEAVMAVLGWAPYMPDDEEGT
jgi:hypothetical protein